MQPAVWKALIEKSGLSALGIIQHKKTAAHARPRGQYKVSATISLVKAGNRKNRIVPPPVVSD